MTGQALVIAILTVGCLVVGILLYVPFLLWFRHRRRQGKSVGAEIGHTRAGYVLEVASATVLLGGFAARHLAPESWFGIQVQGVGGMLRWGISVVVIFGVIGMVLRRANVELQQRDPQKDRAAAGEWNVPTGRRLQWKLVTVHGVPVFVHASLPIGGLVAACFAGSGLTGAATYFFAFAALILVHELGHFAAARALGLKVFAINISGLGGSCVTQAPRDVRGTFLLFSGGLAAQTVLLLLTLAVVAMQGHPESPVGQSVFFTFTVVNLVVAAINLVPGKIDGNLSTDGAVLWDLLFHVTRGGPHPLAQHHAASPVFPPETRLTSIDGMTPPGFLVGVELLNDDRTPTEFVISVLEQHLKLDRESAIGAMLQIHKQGGLLLPLTDLAQAAAVASQITREAAEQGHPLTCRAAEAAAA